MTVYFDRTKVKTPEEIQQQQNVEAVGAIVNFFAKPAILWGHGTLLYQVCLGYLLLDTYNHLVYM